LNKLSVVYDACVLYPAPLRDTLMSLAVTRLFRAHWTSDINDEWTRNLLRARPDISPQQLARTRTVMDRAVPDALVTGYGGLIQTLTLPDPDDRHVLAAAIRCGVGLIITFNVKDFPAHILGDYGIETCHPDIFTRRLLEEHPAEVITALKKQHQRLVRPAHSAEEFLNTLARQGLEQTVAALRLTNEFG